MEVTNDETIADMPDSLAALLIKHQGWRPVTDDDRARFAAVETPDDQPEPEPETEPDPTPPAKKRTTTKTKPEPAPQDDNDTLNPAAVCDDDLPEGIVFADSAYTTIVDEKTGEKIKVLKTHCINKHEYAGDNVKIRVRDGKAHRECQTCLAARRKRARANAKSKAAEGDAT